MKSKGIRVADSLEKKSTQTSNGPLENDAITLEELLPEVNDRSLYSWSFLFLDGKTKQKIEGSTKTVVEEIMKSNHGFELRWESLSDISEAFTQVYDLTLIGCRDRANLHRYDLPKEMYESCDIVIERIDGRLWEIFSKDHEFIDRLKGKFNNIAFLEPDFQEMNISYSGD